MSKKNGLAARARALTGSALRSWVLTIAALAASGLAAGTAGAQQGSDPAIPETAPKQVSEHVYVIEAFPNVGFVVGNDATLVVDTGLGPKNGAIVAKAAQKLSKGGKLYLTTTHFHPEHAAGDAGFPADTILIRPRVQQQELEQDGERIVERFRERPAFAAYLDGVTFRKPDVLFDDEYRLDLGGVHARLMWLGPAHTKGDEQIFVEEDRTLLSGDLAMKDRPPRNFAEGSSAEAWVAILEKLAALDPVHVVPDHGPIGDASLISDQIAQMTKP
ncbi:MAG TPA: MBL fold metallo-hydrolase [Gammaproteobacteria bacterium]|nr:MBL fold metallo-hydrolase [Gammaproteobacteria bacterium]